MAEEKKSKNIMIMVPRPLYLAFKKSCEADYLTMSEYLRSCIREKIKENANK